MMKDPEVMMSREKKKKCRDNITHEEETVRLPMNLCINRNVGIILLSFCVSVCVCV